jgi:hypothetical protein
VSVPGTFCSFESLGFDGWPLVAGHAVCQFLFLAKLFADSAYAGSTFHTALGKVLPNLKNEIVRRSDRAKGFVSLLKRLSIY